MSREIDARMSHLLAMARSLFGEELKGIARTDAFLRQPDYSSRAVDHVYLVFVPAPFSAHLARARYLQAEFPEIGFNYLTSDELIRFPPHGVWQFKLAQWIHGEQAALTLLHEVRCPSPEALRQAIFSIAHLARLYYFRAYVPKVHVWGVRQLGWAMRYVERGLLPLWLGAADISPHRDPQSLADDLAWVRRCNANWPAAEGEMLGSASAFQTAAMRLSRIAEEFCRELDATAGGNEQSGDLAAEGRVSSPQASGSLVASLSRGLGSNLVAVYLHGSAARGDRHQRSDLDVIAVASEVDDMTLQRAREACTDHPRVSLNLMSLAGMRQYPRFRCYTLAAETTRRIHGVAALPSPSLRDDDLAAIDNNLCTIRQVSRAYLAGSSYGPRALSTAHLMVKLADHGCLRLLQKLETGAFPLSRDSSRKFHADTPSFAALLADIAGVSDLEHRMRDALLAGQRGQIEALFSRLLDFTADCGEAVRSASTVATRTRDA